MNADEMIRRYTHEVARSLPRGTEYDIRLELHSLLTEKLERQAEKAGQAPDAEMAAAMLQEFGSPTAVAAGYGRDQYLIGPALFPTFKVVATIILLTIGGLFLVGFFILTLWLEAPLTLDLVLGTLRAFAGCALPWLGVLIVIFALLERLPGGGTNREETWDPRALPEVEEEEDYVPVKLALGVILALLAILLFNGFPHWFIAVQPAPGDVSLVPLLDPAFQAHVPWLTTLWALEISLRLFVLHQRRWTANARWAEYAVSLFGWYVAFRIFRSSPITVSVGLDILVRIGLGIAVLVGAVSAVIQPFQLLFSRQAPAKADDLIGSRPSS